MINKNSWHIPVDVLNILTYMMLFQLTFVSLTTSVPLAKVIHVKKGLTKRWLQSVVKIPYPKFAQYLTDIFYAYIQNRLQHGVFKHTASMWDIALFAHQACTYRTVHTDFSALHSYPSSILLTS